MATLLIAIPGLLLGLIPMICGAVAVCFLIAVAYVVIKRILNALALFFETLFKPKLVYVRMSDDDIKIKYHELDLSFLQ